MEISKTKPRNLETKSETLRDIEENYERLMTSASLLASSPSASVSIETNNSALAASIKAASLAHESGMDKGKVRDAAIRGFDASMNASKIAFRIGYKSLAEQSARRAMVVSIGYELGKEFTSMAMDELRKVNGKNGNGHLRR